MSYHCCMMADNIQLKLVTWVYTGDLKISPEFTQVT
jgi:hypothetical protein